MKDFLKKIVIYILRVEAKIVLLIKKPKVAIEYVIFHELAHLIYPNHSKEFYNFLTLHMPDWKERKRKLEKQY